MYEFKRDQLHLSPSSRVVIHKGPFYDYKILEGLYRKPQPVRTEEKRTQRFFSSLLFLLCFSHTGVLTPISPVVGWIWRPDLFRASPTSHGENICRSQTVHARECCASSEASAGTPGIDSDAIGCVGGPPDHLS